MPAQPRRAAPTPPDRPEGPATSAARVRHRKLATAGVLAIVLLSLVGSLADILQIIDTALSVEHPLRAAGVSLCLVLGPMVIAGLYWWTSERAAFLYIVAGGLVVTLGGFFGGIVFENRRSPVEAPGQCETKLYEGEPSTLQNCRRVEFQDGQTLDLDDRSSRAMNSKRPDVRLTGGALALTGKAVKLSVISSARIAKGTFPISFPGCVEAPPTADPVQVNDMLDAEALCVVTDEKRVAILWLVDVNDEEQSAVFNVTTWRRQRTP